MKDYEAIALAYAEEHGIYSYKVKGNKMRWYSYFGSEGFIKATLDMDIMKETRVVQKTCKHEYNYFCG